MYMCCIQGPSLPARGTKGQAPEGSPISLWPSDDKKDSTCPNSGMARGQGEGHQGRFQR